MQVSDPLAQLEELLAEDIGEATRRASWTLDRVAGTLGERPMVLFGAGSLGHKTLTGLRALGAEPAALTDNDPTKWGSSVDNVPVVAPQEAVERWGGNGIFIVTILSPERRFTEVDSQLKRAGCTNVLPYAALAWRYPDTFLPHFYIAPPQDLLAHAERFREAHALLADERSRDAFARCMRLRLRLDFAAMPDPDPDQYFPPDLVQLDGNDVVVDCGAFDGDTLRYVLDRYGRRFRRWVAFEPDLANFEHMVGYVESLPETIRDDVSVRPLAVAEEAGRVRFAATGTMGSRMSQSGTVEIECVRLDDVELGGAPTFMKFDIEGAEMAALRGGRELIRRHRPVLAVCVYHRPNDLWEIPLFISGLEAGYRLHLRVHSTDGYDTVLYAVPE